MAKEYRFGRHKRGRAAQREGRFGRGQLNYCGPRGEHEILRRGSKAVGGRKWCVYKRPGYTEIGCYKSLAKAKSACARMR